MHHAWGKHLSAELRWRVGCTCSGSQRRVAGKRTRNEIGESILYVFVNRGWALYVKFFSFCISMSRNARRQIYSDAGFCCMAYDNNATQNPVFKWHRNKAFHSACYIKHSMFNLNSTYGHPNKVRCNPTIRPSKPSTQFAPAVGSNCSYRAHKLIIFSLM